MALLQLVDVRVRYGSVEVLHGVNLRVEEGEIVTILGANGAGKSTTLLSISGLVRPFAGEILFEGQDLLRLPSHKVVDLGIAQSPEGRRVFGVMSVLENLRLGAFCVRDKARSEKTLEWIFDLFPRLLERKDQLAGTLSGGEQQMLAIGRALMAQPRLLLLRPFSGRGPVEGVLLETSGPSNKRGFTVLHGGTKRRALRLAHPRYVSQWEWCGAAPPTILPAPSVTPICGLVLFSVGVGRCDWGWPFGAASVTPLLRPYTTFVVTAKRPPFSPRTSVHQIISQGASPGSLRPDCRSCVCRLLCYVCSVGGCPGDGCAQRRAPGRSVGRCRRVPMRPAAATRPCASALRTPPPLQA
jgi:branched-chain amino acid transport system ATP-binding protein